MPQLDLTALLRSAQASVRVSTQNQSIKARLAQRTLAEQRADEYARTLEKRRSLEKALSCNDQDAMRFRWLAHHAEFLTRLAGSSLDQMRRDIDLWIKQDAIKQIAAMRRESLEKLKQESRAHA